MSLRQRELEILKTPIFRIFGEKYELNIEKMKVYSQY